VFQGLGSRQRSSAILYNFRQGADGGGLRPITTMIVARLARPITIVISEWILSPITWKEYR